MRQTAQYKARQFLAQQQSPSRVSEQLLDELTETIMDARRDTADRDLVALEHCREKLGSVDNELLELHYADDLGTRQIADRIQRSQSSVCNSLNRIRSWLLECIKMELARQEHSATNQHG